jgi:dethiobiotin synthetase/adenosylmethionine--8-amino-7-oxononanoate aminotransferase
LISVIRKNPDLISTTAPPPPENPSSYLTETWSGLPVIFDEVFTGIYRLGHFNCNNLLQANPDIVVNAKLLTGGLVPLCTTTASQAIFNAFLGDNKADALMHGHSYTAHAVGCHVAVESMKLLKHKEDAQEWSDSFAQSWVSDGGSRSEHDGNAWSMWSRPFVTSVSRKASVEGVVALGSVLAVSLKDQAGGGKCRLHVPCVVEFSRLTTILGYTSLAAQGLHQRLLQVGEKGWCVHSRVLGNVIYFMTSLTVSPETVKAVEDLLLEELGEI